MRDRLVRISNARLFFDAAEKEIAACRNAIQTAMSDAIRKLTESVEEKLIALLMIESELSALINAASADLMEHISDNNYIPDSFAARTILRSMSDPSSFEMFKWKVSMLHNDLELKINVSFWTPFPEIIHHERKRVLHIENPCDVGEVIGMSANLESAYIDVPENRDQLVIVRDKDLRFYTCSSGQWSPKKMLTPPIFADYMSAYCILEDGSVLCSGGGQDRLPWDYAYHISESGATRELHRLLKSRRSHGVSVYRGFVYLFGGWSGQQLRASEKIRASPTAALLGAEWNGGSDMLSERSCFNPCTYKRLIYLCGGVSCQEAEVYYPVEELHTLLNFQLPGASATFCTVTEESLVVVSKQYVHTWYSNTKQDCKPCSQVHVWGNMMPIRIKNIVYLPCLFDSTGLVDKIDIVSMEVQTEHMPES